MYEVTGQWVFLEQRLDIEVNLSLRSTRIFCFFEKGENTFAVNFSIRKAISRSHILQEDAIFQLDYAPLESHRSKM